MNNSSIVKNDLEFPIYLGDTGQLIGKLSIDADVMSIYSMSQCTFGHKYDPNKSNGEANLVEVYLIDNKGIKDE